MDLKKFRLTPIAVQYRLGKDITDSQCTLCLNGDIATARIALKHLSDTYRKKGITNDLARLTHDSVENMNGIEYGLNLMRYEIKWHRNERSHYIEELTKLRIELHEAKMTINAMNL